PLLILEYVSGVSIKDLAERKLTLDREKDIYDMLMQLTDVVGSLHEKGTFHGRLLPSDVIVTEHDGVLKILLLDLFSAEIHDRFERLEDGNKPELTASADTKAMARLAYTLITGEDAQETSAPKSLSELKPFIRGVNRLASAIDRCISGRC